MAWMGPHAYWGREQYMHHSTAVALRLTFKKKEEEQGGAGGGRGGQGEVEEGRESV